MRAILALALLALGLVLVFALQTGNGGDPPGMETQDPSGTGAPAGESPLQATDPGRTELTQETLQGFTYICKIFHKTAIVRQQR